MPSAQKLDVLLGIFATGRSSCLNGGRPRLRAGKLLTMVRWTRSWHWLRLGLRGARLTNLPARCLGRGALLPPIALPVGWPPSRV